MVGSRGFEPRSARSERAASANCATSRDGPSGWTRTTTTRVKSPGCCVDTTEGMERMTGFEPVPQGLEGPRASVTPHSLWFGLRVSNPSPPRLGPRQPLRHIRSVRLPHSRPNADRCRSPAHRHPSVFKDPALSSWWAARDSNPIAPGENGFTARRRTIRSVPPIWRQRQESNPDPRALEARMLPLHHAAYVTSRLDGLDRRKRHTLPLAWPVSVHGLEAKTKKAF